MSAPIQIYDPSKGVFTAVDQDELPLGFATDLENFYLDRPGKVRKRDGVLAYGSSFPSDNLLRSLFRFENKDLTGGAVWLSLWDEEGVGKIYVSNTAGSSWTLVENVGILASGDEMRALVIGIVLRLAFSRSISPVWYGYIKRKFFHDLWDHSDTTPIWFDNDAAVKYPATWTYTSLTLQSTTGGELGIGHHFYKVVPVFDGVQQGLFATGKAYYEIESGTTNILLLKMGFSTADWNPRTTHLNIYRQVNVNAANDDDALYQLVQVVSTRNEPAVVTGTGDTMELRWYDPDVSWTPSDYDFNGTGAPTNPDVGDKRYKLKISGVEYWISDNQANLLMLSAGEDLPDQYFINQAYTIEEYTCASGGVWPGSGSTVYTGTNGSGARRAYYVAAASYDENEFLNYILKEQSVYRVVLFNNGKVLCLDSDPVNGLGKTLRIARWLWDYSTPNATLRFVDTGLLVKGAHPLAGVTSIEAYYKYHAYFKGRLYGLNLAFDPSGENEQYPDWICFSEVDQPDVIPNANFIMPDSGSGGKGQGIFVLDKADALVVFFRHDIAYLNVPRADPGAWSKHDQEGDIGLINDAAIVRTPIGYFFCYDTGIYFMGMDGGIKGPVSFPIDDVYRAAVSAGSGSSFSAIYLSERRIVLFNLGTSSQAWALEIDSIFGEYPKWFKFPFGTVSSVQVKPERSALDENGYFYLHEYNGTKIYRMNQALTGAESFATKLKTAYIRTGGMSKAHLVRYARVMHKGSDPVTPKVYLDDGASSEVKTALAASAAGEDRNISVKRRCRNIAMEFTTPASITTDTEIRGIELEVEQ